MLCKYPIVKPGVKVVPCGQCMPCRINKKREWAGRLLMESKLHPYSYFVTLTYDEDHCPPELSREDASKFVKSLRKKFPGIRYFLVGEYGDRTGRPHFHVILYTSCIRNTIEAGLRRTCWKKGHVHIGASFNRAVANYASGYVTKKNTKSIEDDGLDGQDKKKIQPEFIRVSQRPALGDGYLPYLIDGCRSSDYVNQFGDVPRSVKIGERTYPLARRIRVKLREHFGICDADGVIGNAPVLQSSFSKGVRSVFEEWRHAYSDVGGHPSLEIFGGLLGQASDNARRAYERRHTSNVIRPL